MGSCRREKTLLQRTKDNLKSWEPGLQPTTTPITHSSDFLTSRCLSWPQQGPSLEPTSHVLMEKDYFQITSTCHCRNNQRFQFSTTSRIVPPTNASIQFNEMWTWNAVDSSQSDGSSSSFHFSLLFPTNVFMFVCLVNSCLWFS